MIKVVKTAFFILLAFGTIATLWFMGSLDQMDAAAAIATGSFSFYPTILAAGISEDVAVAAKNSIAPANEDGSAEKSFNETASQPLPTTTNTNTNTTTDILAAGISQDVVSKKRIVPANDDGSAKKVLGETALQPLPTTTTTTANTTTARLIKFYAVHIGPSKTGTTAIQTEARDNPFGVNTLAEDKDNIIYIGKKGDKNMKEMGSNKTIRYIDGKYISTYREDDDYRKAVNCMHHILDNYYNSTDDSIDEVNKRLDTNKKERASLKKHFIEECWAVRDAEYMLGYSLLDSQEAYSYDPRRQRGFFPNYLMLGRRFRLFDILGYERLVVVGAYRRYAEWIVSVYTESIKFECLRKKQEGKSLANCCASLEKYLIGLSRETGNTKFNARWYHNLNLTLPRIAKDGPSNLQTKILNYFQLPHETAQTNSDYNNNNKIGGDVKTYRSITTEFYCDALGEELTPHSCNYHKAREEEPKQSSLVTNKGTTSGMAYQSVVATGHKLGYIRKSNITTWKDLSDYHSKDLGLSWTDTMPLQCPDEYKLKKILETSLEFEKLVMPDFYATPLGKAEHERLFWDVWLKEKKLFCWVDVEKLFQNTTSWDEIIKERIVSYNWSSVSS